MNRAAVLITFSTACSLLAIGCAAQQTDAAIVELTTEAPTQRIAEAEVGEATEAKEREWPQFSESESSERDGGYPKAAEVRQIFQLSKPEYEKARKVALRSGMPLPVAPEINYVESILTFQVGSAEIDPSGYAALRELARGLLFGDVKWGTYTIEGHTDPSGTPEFNQRLAEERAKAVLEFLRQESPSLTAKFEIVAVADRDLLDKDNPLSRVNRRVRIERIQ